VNVEELDFGTLSNSGSNTKLSEFLTFAPVLLRVQNQRVVTELAITATADLIPDLSFCSLLNIDETNNSYSLTAHRNNHLLSQEENQQLLSQLPPWLFYPHDQPEVFKGDKLANDLNILLGAKVIYIVPVRTPTRTFGYFLAGSDQQIKPVDWSYLRSLAELTAIALDNATRFDDLKEAAYEMGLVNEMAGSLAASLNGEELFNSFIARLHNVVSVERVTLALLPPLGETYSLPFCWDGPLGRSRRTYLKNLTLAGSPFEEAIQRQEIVTGNWESRRADEKFNEVNIFSPDFPSQMIIPLIAKRKVVGAIALGSKDVDIYQEGRIRRSLLEKLAALFALALLNSRLYEEKQLSAEFDSRIGVYNHDFFDRELTAQIRRSRRDETMLGLMMVDMDNLKMVNDKYGHLAGDEALRHIANMIGRCVRATDVVARYGGDEFGVMLPGCTPTGLEVVAEKTRRTISSTPLILENGEQVALSVSIGAVLCPDDANTPRDLIQQADAAMYIAKQSRNQVRIGTNAHLPHVSEIELTTTENTEKLNSPENLTEWLAEDYERFLLWVGGNRDDIESKILHELNERLQETNEKLNESNNRNAQLQAGLWSGLKAVAGIIENREPYLAGGAKKMIKLVRLIGVKINLAPEAILDLEAAAWLSNLGRVLIPESILKYQGKLNDTHWQRIRQIPQDVVGILMPFDQLLSPSSLIAIKHQRENFDGSGYPLGLVGEEIPLSARILGIASALVAMSQDRPFRSRRTKAVGQRQLERGAGRQFDPVLASLLINQLAEGQLDFLDFA
jgi:diguanylate cyclase (GGDEF)-like protein